MESILEVKNVSLRKGDKDILRDISLEVWKGHIHAFVGKNGAGKTTLASVIMGRPGYRDHKGDIFFKGESIKSLEIDERARKGITLSLQESARFEGLTVKTYLELSSRDKDSVNINKILDSVNLNPEKYLNRQINESLSGGERKKVELASILSMRPDIVMLDEPDSGIDVASLNHIFAALEYFTSYGGTVIMITHSLTVLNYSDHAFLICDGKIKTKGILSQVLPVFQKQCENCVFGV
jgi:Fe-S cluster assembly ATP-binding protein